MEGQPSTSGRRLEASVTDDEETRPNKRQRLEGGQESQEKAEPFSLLMYVRWVGPSVGQTKINMLQLRPVDGVDDLQELGKELVHKAYPEPQPMPSFITSPDYCRFTPQRECLAVPGDIVRTELRVVLVYEGWEYCILKRTLTPVQPAGGDMVVTAVEFEGRPEEAILGTLGFRISLIAYPIVALRKEFLEGVKERLLRDPANFTGIL